MDILHWRIGRCGIDMLWLKTSKSLSPFYLLPTIRIGKADKVRYADVCFLYLLITFYIKSKNYGQK